MVKIIDCFIFYNEIDILNYRLNILNDVVDYFVIVESTYTFAGHKKQLFFLENKHLFDRFKEKIIHVIVYDIPYKYPHINYINNEQWKNEFFQRNSISHGLEKLELEDDDIIMITDADEIPDPNTLNIIKQNKISIDIFCLEMDYYYYNLHNRFDNKWIK